MTITMSSVHSPTFPSLHLRHNSFSNPSFASPTSQALHLIHLASRPWFYLIKHQIWNRHYLWYNLIYNVMRGIQKETCRRPGNRNHYLYVRSIGPGCWGTSPIATQAVNGCLLKFPRLRCEPAAWWRQRWIVCLSQPYLGDQNSVISGREVWPVWRVTALDDWRMLLITWLAPMTL